MRNFSAQPEPMGGAGLDLNTGPYEAAGGGVMFQGLYLFKYLSYGHKLSE